MLRMCNPSASKPTLAKSIRGQAEIPEPTKEEPHFTLDADIEKIRLTIAKAFAGDNGKENGEPFLGWSLNHHKFASQEAREQFFRFIMAYPLQEDLSYNNFILSLQQPDDTIAATLTVQEFDPVQRAAKQKSWLGKIQKQCWFMTSTFHVLVNLKEKVPPLLEGKEHKEDLAVFTKKTHKWEQENTNWQLEHGPKKIHWYVHIVACHPDFQGQGKGKALMARLCEMADQMGQAMYLECGEKNRIFYEKFGFVVKHSEPFVDPEDPDGEPFLMHLMERKAIN